MENKYVLFQLSGDKAIYVADLAAGTVERRDAADIGAELEAPPLRGLAFAVTAQARGTPPSHMYFPDR
jgi:hypothetical protein